MNLEAKDGSEALTIEKVLDEKRLYDVSQTLESVTVAASEPDFTLPCRSLFTGGRSDLTI